MGVAGVAMTRRAVVVQWDRSLVATAVGTMEPGVATDQEVGVADMEREMGRREVLCC